MANTLTSLIPTLYSALDVVSRELIGFIPAVRLDADVARAAKDQSVVAFKTPASTASDVTPGVNVPDSGDQTIGNVSVTISKARMVPVRWNGEEQRGINSGPGYRNVLQDQFAQAFRTLSNEFETDIAAAVKAGASRAYGTAGTTPFGTAGDYTDASNVLKILKDNGAPTSDLQLVLNTAAGANIRGKQGGRGVDAEGTSDILRRGVLLDIHGFAVRESAKAATHTKGTGASYLVNNGSGIAVGGATIAADTGSGTVLAGDVVTFAADTVNKYVVGTALSAGSFALNDPGALVAIADNNAITVGNSYAHNAAFARSAVVAAARLPALPEEGDSADDRVTVVDPVSGLAFEVAMYRQFRQVSYIVSLAWGVKAVKSEHIATLLG